MTDEYPISDIERTLSAYLYREEEAETPCLSDEQLQALIARGHRSARYPESMQHLASCNRCWEALGTLRADATRTQVPALLLQDTGGPVQQAGERVWLTNVRKRTSSITRRLQALLADGFIEPAKPVQRVFSLAPVWVTRDTGDQVTPLSPVNTMVRTLPPVLRWQPLTEAEDYEVVLLQLSRSSSDEIWNGTTGGRTECRLPAEITLHPAHLYLWQATATSSARKLSSPSAWFGLLSAADAADLEQLERDYSESALLLLCLYERYGLYEEAQRQIERLQALNLNNDLVRSLELRLAQRRGARSRA
jgi:hypothetical protein